MLSAEILVLIFANSNFIRTDKKKKIMMIVSPLISIDTELSSLSDKENCNQIKNNEDVHNLKSEIQLLYRDRN